MGRLSMRKISEVLRQKLELGLSNREIAKSVGVSSSTVSDYVSRAKLVGIGWPLPEGITEQDLYDKLFLPVRVSTKIRPQPDWQYICTELRRKGVTLQLLWREHRNQHPNGLGYAQFCRYYQAYKKNINPIMRQVYKGGEKAFVDYAGMKIDWIDATTGEVFQSEIFVGCLGASQYIFAEATKSQQLPDWIESHMHMFEYFEGVPEILTPDNLRSGVAKAHRYDPDINANYQHFAEYYGVAIVPARVYSPKDKAKVENAVGIIERQILAPMRNMTFTSIGEINAEIKFRVIALNKQQFQKMKTSRYELFIQLDKPALKPLPSTRYEYAVWRKAKINIDYHFVFEDCYYSVPYKYVGKKVEICGTNKTVECLYDNTRIALHVRSYKKYSYSTINEHMPEAHKEHAKYSVERITSWANKIGENTAAFVTHMMQSRAFPQQAYRASLGLLRLSHRYGELRLDKACAKALSVGATRYQQVQAILKNNLEEVPIDNTSKEQTTPSHGNIRGSEYYK